LTPAPVPGFLRKIKGLRDRMSMNTVTRAQLAEAVYANVGLSRNESAALLETVLERMSAALEAGEAVKISAFGTFLVRQKGQRIGRNPKTGVEVPILPRKVLSFRPSQVLKARINHEPVGVGDE
jgi:integration host factor subunit alpha